MQQLAISGIRLRNSMSLTIATLLLFFFGTFAFGVWLMYFDNSPPFSSTYVQTLNASGEAQTVFRPGDVFLVRRDLCFTRDAPVTMGRTLQSVDRAEYINVYINTSSGMIKKGCIPNANTLKIPEYTPPGKYKLSVIVQYSNNAFQNGAAELPAPTIDIVR